MKNQNTPNSRRLAVFLSIALLGSVVFLTGCEQPAEPAKNTGRFVLISDDTVAGESLRVYRDTVTGKEYLSTKQGYSGGVCPL